MKIDIASPCKRDWAKMKGDDAVRFCGDCKMNVYNLSALSQQQVLQLVKEKEGKVCVRLFQRADGTAITRDCPVGVTRKRRTYAFSMAAMFGLLAAPFMTRSEQAATGDPPQRVIAEARAVIEAVKVKLGLSKPPVGPIYPMMGKMAYRPPPGSP